MLKHGNQGIDLVFSRTLQNGTKEYAFCEAKSGSGLGLLKISKTDGFRQCGRSFCLNRASRRGRTDLEQVIEQARAFYFAGFAKDQKLYRLFFEKTADFRQTGEAAILV